mmetsp:Transcript_13979/g.40225  ORF Transcript_13979/g.40225 Transcript_13979/m.40225 type:complete len:327 (-) Transcript_13979:1389-2369(-)
MRRMPRSLRRWNAPMCRSGCSVLSKPSSPASGTRRRRRRRRPTPPRRSPPRRPSCSPRGSCPATASPSGRQPKRPSRSSSPRPRRWSPSALPPAGRRRRRWRSRRWRPPLCAATAGRRTTTTPWGTWWRRYSQVGLPWTASPSSWRRCPARARNTRTRSRRRRRYLQSWRCTDGTRMALTRSASSARRRRPSSSPSTAWRPPGWPKAATGTLNRGRARASRSSTPRGWPRWPSWSRVCTASPRSGTTASESACRSARRSCARSRWARMSGGGAAVASSWTSSPRSAGACGARRTSSRPTPRPGSASSPSTPTCTLGTCWRQTTGSC